jgi:UDP-glucose 4-epimerase
MRMRLLVTGGAGYIGAHVVGMLRAAGHDVVVVDDLSAGDATRIDAPLVPLDLARQDAPETLAAVLAEHQTQGVIHLAARKRVAESVRRPGWYREQNVGGVRHLLRGMAAAGVDRLIFSSTAAVYGDVAAEPVDESARTAPVNPYGETKLEGERLITAGAKKFGLRAVSLRYFNAVGAARPELGDNAPANLVPIVFEQLERGAAPVIHGDDWDTPDGTCVRDYVHVADIAEAHEAALSLLNGRPGNVALNVGTGEGKSVREMLEHVFAATGIRIDPVVAARRPGDSAHVTASVERIKRVLGWRATRSVEEMVSSAWAAHRARVAA